MTNLSHVNGATPSEHGIDLVDMAERCRIAGNAPEMLPADAKLFGECADVFDAMRTVLASTQEVIRQHRMHQYQVTVDSIAGALDAAAIEYERNGSWVLATPQGVLREMAESLRASLKPKTESPLIVKGSFE